MRSFSSRVLLICWRRAAGERRNDEFDCGLVTEVGIMAFGGFRLRTLNFSAFRWRLSLRLR